MTPCTCPVCSAAHGVKPMKTISHALVLNLHQPPGNLEQLLDEGSWEPREILEAMDRMPRMLWGYEDVARVHLSLSGSLLETLSSPTFQERVFGMVDCGSLLWYLQNQQLFKILGTGYYHPVLPLIPEADREAHLKRWQDMAGHLFWRNDFSGFWPPEMSFCMEMIPLLKQKGYRYVLVDSENVKPVGKMSWEELRYRPHIARYGEDEIIVVVRDRDLSNAQEGGMEFGWFDHEVQERTKWCDFEPLVTTATDGDNGGWFRNHSEQANFWGVFYRQMLEQSRAGTTPLRPTFIDDYLDRNGAHGEVVVESAAWNTGWHHGKDFVQWTGSQMQKEALARINETSAELHKTAQQVWGQPIPEVHHELSEAFWHLLRSETSCNIFWGEAWVHKCHEDLDTAWQHLKQARKQVKYTTPAATSAPQP